MTEYARRLTRHRCSYKGYVPGTGKFITFTEDMCTVILKNKNKKNHNLGQKNRKIKIQNKKKTARITKR